MAMNPEVKAQWLSALRSGEFKQTTGQLKCGDGHCCLGVLSEISGKPFEGADPVPSEEICSWAGIPDKNPHVVYEGNEHTLAYLNDQRGLDFLQLADLIEAQL